MVSGNKNVNTCIHNNAYVGVWKQKHIRWGNKASTVYVGVWKQKHIQDNKRKVYIRWCLGTKTYNTFNNIKCSNWCQFSSILNTLIYNKQKKKKLTTIIKSMQQIHNQINILLYSIINDTISTLLYHDEILFFHTNTIIKYYDVL